MKPQGHHSVADEAGLPLLRAAFGNDHRALGAFYLGNWIADFSQLVEPVAMAGIRGEIAKATGFVPSVAEMFGPHRRLITGIYDWIYDNEELERCEEPGVVPRAIFETLMAPENIVKAIERHTGLMERIDKALDELLLGQKDTRDTPIGQIMRDIFFVLGYFEFVFEPENDPSPDPHRLKMGEFKAVFGEREGSSGTRRVAGASASGGGIAAPATPGAFTQYYPHEHYDRPSFAKQENVHAPGLQNPDQPLRLGHTPGGPAPDGNRSRKPWPAGPRALTSSDKVKRTEGNPPASVKDDEDAPDIYSYLRDYMEGTAGLLAELDDAFGKALSAPPVAAGREGAYPDEWVQTLAKAGHTMHQVEDFFAHSNFVELAIKQLDLKATFIPRKKGDPDADFSRNVIERRLKRFVNYAEGKKPEKKEPETWVVTGYFDTTDTIIAIMHTLQAKQKSYKTNDPYSTRFEENEDPEGEWQEFLKHPIKKPVENAERSMLELYWVMSDRDAIKDPNNKVANVIRKSLPEIEKELKENTRPRLTVKDINAIAEVLPMLQGADPEVVKAFANIYILASNARAINETRVSVMEMVATIQKMILNPVGLIVEEFGDMLGDNLRFAIQRRVFDGVGADRIGCHSLLAKDHEGATLYQPMRHCAAAVHAHIMHVLLRDRSEDPEGKSVDWLELLEAMFRNPATPQADGATVDRPQGGSETIKHIARRGEQLDTLSQPAQSLTRRFARNSEQGRYRPYDAKEPADGFHWRMIADETFGTKDMSDAKARGVINNHLKKLGAPRVGANYALKPGMTIKIPHQKVPSQVKEAARIVTPWWEKVLDVPDPKKLDFRKLAAKLGEPSKMGHTPQYLPREAFDKMIARGKCLREVFREFYRPDGGAGGKSQVPDHSAWPSA